MPEKIYDIEQAGTHDCRYYHTTVELTEKLRETVAGLVGVEQAFTERYRLTVFKGQAFEWDDVEPGILAVLAHFGEPSTEGN